jgi:hypothetical protein
LGPEALLSSLFTHQFTAMAQLKLILHNETYPLPSPIFTSSPQNASHQKWTHFSPKLVLKLAWLGHEMIVHKGAETARQAPA